MLICCLSQHTSKCSCDYLFLLIYSCTFFVCLFYILEKMFFYFFLFSAPQPPLSLPLRLPFKLKYNYRLEALHSFLRGGKSMHPFMLTLPPNETVEDGGMKMWAMFYLGEIIITWAHSLVIYGARCFAITANKHLGNSFKKRCSVWAQECVKCEACIWDVAEKICDFVCSRKKMMCNHSYVYRQ